MSMGLGITVSIEMWNRITACTFPLGSIDAMAEFLQRDGREFGRRPFNQR